LATPKETKASLLPARNASFRHLIGAFRAIELMRLELAACRAHDRSVVQSRTSRRGLLALAGALVLLPIARGGSDSCRAQGSGAILDDSHLRNIFKRLDEAGRTREIPAKVTAALGVTKGDETLQVREMAFERADYEHGFYKSLRPGDDRIILAFRTPQKKWTAFLTNSRLRLIAAASWNAGETPTPWKGAEAAQAFANELAYWAILAETF
jgi:hypothetical protein